MTDLEKHVFNIRYVLRMLKDNDYSREEIINELEQELQHATTLLKNAESGKDN